MLSTLGTLKINHGVGTIVAKPSVSNYLRIVERALSLSLTGRSGRCAAPKASISES